MNDEFKLGESTKWLMLGVAIFFDLLSIIPVVNWIIWVIGNLTFFLWFKMNGMSFSKPKNLFSFIGADIIELIPGLSMLPAWTALILYLTRIKKVVDKVTERTDTLNNIVKFRQKNVASESYDDELDRAA